MAISKGFRRTAKPRQETRGLLDGTIGVAVLVLEALQGDVDFLLRKLILLDKNASVAQPPTMQSGPSRWVRGRDTYSVGDHLVHRPPSPPEPHHLLALPVVDHGVIHCESVWA
jgi:hypothetical protein